MTRTIDWAWEGSRPVTSASATARGRVWIGRIDLAAEPKPTAEDLRDAERHSPLLRRAFFARRAVCRTVLADWLDMVPDAVRVAYDTHGRPRLCTSGLRTPDPSLFISTASRDGWIAVGLSAGPVGVDLERADAPAEPAWNVLHPREAERLRRRPADTRGTAFLALWTAKEAYLKALGLGLSREPAQIDVEPQEGSGFALRDRDRAVAVAAAAWAPPAPGGLQVACVVLPA